MSLLTSFTRNNVRSHPQWKTGRYYDTRSSLASENGTAALTAGIVYAMPIFVPVGCGFDRIGTNVTAGASAGKLLRVGFATAGNNGLPDRLLVDSGTLAADGIAGVEATVAVMPPPGWNWLLVTSDGTPTLNTYVSTREPTILGWSALTSTTIEVIVSYTRSFQALPSSFGTPDGYGSVTFRVMVRAS